MLDLKSNPALVVMDMQNGFCHPEGTFGKLGMSIQNHLDIVPTINELRSESHASNIPVFFLYLAYNDDYSDAGILWAEPERAQMKSMKAFVRST